MCVFSVGALTWGTVKWALWIGHSEVGSRTFFVPVQSLASAFSRLGGIMSSLLAAAQATQCLLCGHHSV